MPLNTPSWWYGKASLISVLLTPAALVWNSVSRLRRFLIKPYASALPVICIGNFTAGGAGKTPAALAVARILLSSGEKPVFLTRGYGGRTLGPHLVELSHDDATIVGDEPLLLARVAPTIVAVDRAEGAKFAELHGASVIVMDDGFQNPGLVKTLSLIVVDAKLGLGNEHVIPAGPLRESLGFQLAQADGLILVGNGDMVERLQILADQASLPILKAQVTPDQDCAWLKDTPVVAFSGIANPDKFFRMVEDLGGRLVAHVPYPDHHPYSPEDERKLLELAALHEAKLVTTQKDIVRIEGNAELQMLKEVSRPLPVSLQFNDEEAARKIISSAITTT